MDHQGLARWPLCWLLVLPVAAAAAQPADQPNLGPERSFLSVLGKVGAAAGMAVVEKASGSLIDNLLAHFRKESVPTPAPGATREAAAATSAPSAGLAFDVLLAQPDGSQKHVDPLRHVFRTGDAFVVRFAPNLPGSVTVANVNALGQINVLGTWQLAGGQPSRLPATGAYRFAPPSGAERLVFEYRPCRGGQDAGLSRQELVAALPACSAAAGPPRDIVFDQSGTTGFAIAQQPVSAREPASYRVTLVLQHVE